MKAADRLRRRGLLLIACAACAGAIRLDSRQIGLPSVPVVAGTQRLDDEEMAGRAPIFVDAFPNAEMTQMVVIMNFSPLFPVEALRTSPEWKSWKAAVWECKWANMKTQKTRSRLASILHSTFDDSVANITDRGVSRSEVFMNYHHAIVLACQVPTETFATEPSWYLTLSATDKARSHVKYLRSGIPAVKGSFVHSSDFDKSLLCTMVFQDDHTISLLRPWAKFHLDMGFDQILLYVEDEDPTWTTEALADLKDNKSRVTVVPFFFGNVSKQRAFHMQAGMEQHCLYQARGRVSWLGHADIDEYFELRGQVAGLTVMEFLDRMPSSTGVVSVRSQFWADVGPRPDGVPFPCYISCKQPDYFESPHRSKWIGRPTELHILNPHIVQTSKATMIRVADPSTELRLNHYKGCAIDERAKNCGQVSTCLPDLTFRSRCTKILG